MSDCFERADLEAKYETLSEAQKRGETSNGFSASASARAGEPRSNANAKSTAGSSTANAEASAGGFANARRFFRESIDALKESVSVSSIWASVREKMNRVNAKYGTGNKARSMLEDARRKVEDADAKLGVTKWFKTNVPKALDQYAKVKNTPVGRFANLIFWIWLFTSGIFWSLLYFGLTATFLINLLMPSLIADQLENMQRRAQEQMNAGMGGGMGGMGSMDGMGGMGGGYGGGMGGMGYDPRAGGAAGGQQGRRSYGGSAGDTIDVDARVSDD